MVQNINVSKTKNSRTTLLNRISKPAIIAFFFFNTLTPPNHATAAAHDWQYNVDVELVGKGFQSAAIIGFDGNTLACSNLILKSGEGILLINTYKDPASSFANGIKIASIKYLTIKANSKSIYGKKGSGGIMTVKTNQCILIGIYDSTLQPGNAAVIIENLADTLRENGN